MPNFAYKGMNAQGKNAAGVIDAESEKAARVKLRKIGIFPTQVGVQGAKKKGGGFSFNADIDLGKYLQSISVKDIATMTRQMSTLIAANIPIVETLSALVEQTENPKLKTILGSVKESVVQGGRLSDALAAHPKTFGTIYVAMVGAGEAAGAMDIVLTRLAELTEKQAALKSKILGALMYPIIMGGVGVLLVSFLVVYVVPKVTKIFEDTKAALPLPTRMLVFVSGFLQNYWYVVIIAVVLIVYGVKRWLKTKKGRYLYDKMSLKVPIFGKLFKLVAVSRFARTLATMLASGVQLLKAMDIVKNVVENEVLMETIETTRTSVKEGESIAEPLRRSGYFPPLVTHMISIGEKTGELETMLMRVADSYDQQVDNMVGTLTTLLEPIMILVMGGVVGFIVMSILLPILQLNQLGS